MKPERRLQATPLTLEILREPAHIEHVKTEWTRFAATIEDVTPFQLPAWQLAWWRHFGAGRLHVMLFRSMETLVGVVPCFVWDNGGHACMSLVGSGIASYLEPPVAKARQAEVAGLLRGHLLANTAWQVCDWHNLRFQSPFTSLNPGDKFEVTPGPDREYSEVPLLGTFQQYWDARSFSLRRNFLKYLDRNTFAGRPRFETVVQADPEFVNALVRFPSEAGTVAREGFEGAREGANAFLYDLTRTLDDADMLRLFGLRYQNKLAAVLLAFDYRGTLYSFAAGHDPEFEAQGFGRLLLFECLRYAFDNRYRAWNFLGGNDAYKLLWGAQTFPTTHLRIQRKA